MTDKPEATFPPWVTRKAEKPKRQPSDWGPGLFWAAVALILIGVLIWGIETITDGLVATWPGDFQ